ncbi:MAG: tRNA (guanine(10)-N(2))-dimethyltransferase [Candidatus Hermodarchaeota archaeon]
MRINKKSQENKRYSLRKESFVDFYIHNSDKDKIPSKSMNVFYNKKMEINRDITNSSIVAYNEIFNPESLIIVDSMAASGIGSIRLLQECKNIKKIYINDINPLAIKLVKKNLELNKINPNYVEVSNEDSNLLCLKLAQQIKVNSKILTKRPNVIIIDPFGTPSHFIDAALKLIQKENGLLCITATDTAVLFGVRKEACFKKYMSKPLHNEYCKETGARILLHFISKIANINNLGIIPLLTFYSGHFIKIFAHTYKNKDKIYTNFSNYGYIIHCNNCGHRSVYTNNIVKIPHQCPYCKEDKIPEYAGPLWIEKIHNKEFIKRVLFHNLNSNHFTKTKVNKILSLISNEIDMPITYYNIHLLCERLKLSQVPKIDLIIKQIKRNGGQASRTHFDFLSIKTNIGIEELQKILIEIEK